MNESAAELPAPAATILELPAVPSGEPKLTIPPAMTEEERELAEVSTPPTSLRPHTLVA
jgi:hypothetical protein